MNEVNYKNQLKNLPIYLLQLVYKTKELLSEDV